jgi:hypothetical protein
MENKMDPNNILYIFISAVVCFGGLANVIYNVAERHCDPYIFVGIVLLLFAIIIAMLNTIGCLWRTTNASAPTSIGMCTLCPPNVHPDVFRSPGTRGLLWVLHIINGFIAVANLAVGIYVMAQIDKCNNSTYGGIVLFFLPIILYICFTYGYLWVFVRSNERVALLPHSTVGTQH